MPRPPSKLPTDPIASKSPDDAPPTPRIGFRDPRVETERAISIPVPEVDARATITVLSGAESGRVVALRAEETILGRGSSADVCFEDATVSRVHARVICQGDAYVLEDLSSTNGTFLRGAPVKRAPIASGDRLQLGPHTVLRFAVADDLERGMLIRLVESSTRDAVTGAYNRTFLLQRLEAELAYARRHGSKLAVLLLDLDHFKRINDKYGHAAGDAVLRAIARKVSATLRMEDLFARYGGEEFVILARASAHLDAFRLAERVRAAVAAEQVQLEGGEALSVTVSIGIAQPADDPQTTMAEELLKLADARMYRAKAAGRNVVCSEQ
jgi:two-component system cell cycle response regulator